MLSLTEGITIWLEQTELQHFLWVCVQIIFCDKLCEVYDPKMT